MSTAIVSFTKFKYPTFLVITSVFNAYLVNILECNGGYPISCSFCSRCKVLVVILSSSCLHHSYYQQFVCTIKFCLLLYATM
jgi:hypothetical protein